MTTSIDAGRITEALASCPGVVWTATWRGAVILAIVATVTLLWRRGPAAARYLVWMTALSCLLCLPIFVKCSPSWPAPTWTVPSNLILGLPTSLVMDSTTPPGVVSKLFSQSPQPPVTKADARASSHGLAAAWSDVKQFIQWQTILLAVWLLGVVAGLTRVLGSMMQLRRMARRTSPCTNPAWLDLVDKLRAEYRIGRRVRLLVSDTSMMPMTWGVWRPTVALPAESSDWPAERLRVVLRHELAHVKRWDSLTQRIAHAVCAIYWFNPLTWFAANQMRATRELACDDMVLNTGTRPSDYARHLVEIAGRFTSAPRLATVPMVRRSGLNLRVTAILDARRRRNGIAAITAAPIVLGVFSLGLLIGSIRLEAANNQPQQPWSLDRSAVSAQLKRFIAEKIAQAREAAKTEGKELPPAFDPYFAAAAKGDWQTVTNYFGDPERRFVNVHQRGGWWQPAMEINGTFEVFAIGDEKYLIPIGQDIINSVPRGSIYFGGTDCGRFLVTALSKSHVNADPFFTLTQNALADNNYANYLRSMYGNRIAIPSEQDVQRSFGDYITDAQRRMKENKLKPGEELRTSSNGRVSAWGVTSVMEINARIVKLIFDMNPDHECYIEESYVIDWMYPYLEPHGLILKLNRQPLAQLDPAVVARDREYWDGLTKQLLADPRFLGNKLARGTYAKLRSAIGGVYAYRKMTDEAEYSFKQALKLGPDSPEANFRLARLYGEQKRFDDGITLLRLWQERDASNQKIQDGINQLEREKQLKPATP